MGKEKGKKNKNNILQPPSVSPRPTSPTLEDVSLDHSQPPSLLLPAVSDSNPTPLATTAHYYLVEDHTTTWKKELLLQIFLLFVSVSGAYLYANPAKDDAERSDQGNLAWLYVASTCLPIFATLYVPTDLFFQSYFYNKIPPELIHYLRNPKSSVRRTMENTLTGFISALSAFVLTMILFQFPPAGWTMLEIWFLAVVIFVDYTIFYFLPAKLMLTQEIWRFPLLPVERFVLWLWSCRDRNLSDDEKAQRLKERIKRDAHQKLKEAIIKQLTLAQERLNRQSFVWDWKSVSYHLQLHETLRNLSTLKNPLLDLSYHAHDQESHLFMPPTVNRGVFLLLSAVGALWIWASAVGSYATPFNQFFTWTQSVFATLLITAVPIYTAMVLFAFLGTLFVGRPYEYLMRGGDVSKIPVEIKFAPKLFVTLMCLNGLMMRFSSATAVDLIQTQVTYDWAQPFMPFLLGCAYTGVAYVGFMSVFVCVSTMFLKIARHLTRGDYSELARSNEKIDQLKRSILLMEGEQLERELTAIGSEQRGILVGMDNGNYHDLIDHENNFTESQALVQKAHRPNCCVRLFRSVRKGKESERLINSEESVAGYSSRVDHSSVFEAESCHV